MTKTIRAVFDGEALHPEEPVDLQRNKTYVITIEREVPVEEGAPEEAYPLTEIARLATDMGVTDLSTGHDRYAHHRIEDERHGA
jgi:hypothetical protein